MTDGLFEEPKTTPRVLSQLYSKGTYRARKGRVAKWTPYKSRTGLPCDECMAEQHETFGQTFIRSRSQATVRRSLPGGPDLLLCAQHAYLWRKKDTDDTG